MNLLNRIFKKKVTSSADKLDTLPTEKPSTHFQGYPKHDRNILVGTAQSTGLERSHNEDALFVMQGNSAGDQSIPTFGLFVVADNTLPIEFRYWRCRGRLSSRTHRQSFRHRR